MIKMGKMIFNIFKPDRFSKNVGVDVQLSFTCEVQGAVASVVGGSFDKRNFWKTLRNPNDDTIDSS